MSSLPFRIDRLPVEENLFPNLRGIEDEDDALYERRAFYFRMYVRAMRRSEDRGELWNPSFDHLARASQWPRPEEITSDDGVPYRSPEVQLALLEHWVRSAGPRDAERLFAFSYHPLRQMVARAVRSPDRGFIDAALAAAADGQPVVAGALGRNVNLSAEQRAWLAEWGFRAYEGEAEAAVHAGEGIPAEEEAALRGRVRIASDLLVGLGEHGWRPTAAQMTRLLDAQQSNEGRALLLLADLFDSPAYSDDQLARAVEIAAGAPVVVRAVLRSPRSGPTTWRSVVGVGQGVLLAAGAPDALTHPSVRPAAVEHALSCDTLFGTELHLCERLCETARGDEFRALLSRLADKWPGAAAAMMRERHAPGLADLRQPDVLSLLQSENAELRQSAIVTLGQMRKGQGRGLETPELRGPTA